MRALEKATKAVAVLVLLLALLGGALPPGSPAFLASAQEPATTDKIAPAVQEAMAAQPAGEMTAVIVTLKPQANLSRILDRNRQVRIERVINALQNMANATQRRIQALLEARSSEGKVAQFESFWVFNGLAATATSDVIAELAALPEVDTVTLDDTIQAPEAAADGNPPELNLSLVNAPALWELGYRGQGIVVANMDTGVYLNHPDLVDRWRGGANSWYDPNGQHPAGPFDSNGHGTKTMGVMVGGDLGGTAIGVAPEAQWIAVKIFNDQDDASDSAIHAGFQWLLDPDGNPGTPDTPHVVNNSWTFQSPGCDLEFELDLQSLRAAGILPIFAAGNVGPGAGTSVSPSNNPSAFAVGATDDADLIYAYSSRGPSSCDEAQTVFPEMVAPGVSIRTTDLYSTYDSYATGTSLAAPHVAGGLALLLDAFPSLLAAEQEAALLNGAQDLGLAGADNDFGQGRLDLPASYQWLAGGEPTPTPPPDDTNLALNQPVSVSSFEDGSHDGSKAVDGDQATFWKSGRAKGKNKLPSEWITVDLGSSAPVVKVVLEWNGNYATDYTIQVSQDNSIWTQVYGTMSGDGGTDTIVFSATAARFVKMESTAWSSDSLRNWLREFEVYGSGGGSSPTPTPTPPPPTPTPTPPPPTPTPTPLPPTPTPTPPPGGDATMHVSDLDGSSTPGSRNRWNATVTIRVHQAHSEGGAAVANATVDGAWSNGASGSGSCVTDSAGQCSITKNNVKGNQSSVTFTVTNVTHGLLAYQASDNHDADADSNGTQITVSKP